MNKTKILTFSILLCLISGITWHNFSEKNEKIEKEDVSINKETDKALPEGIETIEPLTPSLIAQNGKLIEQRENKELPV